MAREKGVRAKDSGKKCKWREIGGMAGERDRVTGGRMGVRYRAGEWG